MVNTSVKHRGKLQALSSVDGSIFFVSRLALVLSAVWAVIYLGAGKHAISFIAAGVGIGSLISTLLSANERYASAKHVFSSPRLSECWRQHWFCRQSLTSIGSRFALRLGPF